MIQRQSHFSPIPKIMQPCSTLFLFHRDGWCQHGHLANTCRAALCSRHFVASRSAARNPDFLKPLCAETTAGAPCRLDRGLVDVSPGLGRPKLALGALAEKPPAGGAPCVTGALQCFNHVHLPSLHCRTFVHDELNRWVHHRLGDGPFCPSFWFCPLGLLLSFLLRC